VESYPDLIDLLLDRGVHVAIVGSVANGLTKAPAAANSGNQLGGAAASSSVRRPAPE
jgi:hypothetical protein